MTDFSMQDFIQDFLEESAEHLRNIRRHLLALEGALQPEGDSLDEAVVKVTTVNELFRSFHTLKGLSGMVGLRDAEELSHKLESVLRAIQRTEIEITSDLIDELLKGSQVLEAVIATVRSPGSLAPEIGSQLQRLSMLLDQPVNQRSDPTDPSTPAPVTRVPLDLPGERETEVAFPLYPELSTSLDATDLAVIHAAGREGKGLFVGVFTPSAEKAEAGININQVRAALSERGEILKSVPLIRGASVQFALLVAFHEPLDQKAFRDMEWSAVDPGSIPGKASTAATGGLPGSMPEPAVAATPPPIPSVVRVDLDRLDELMNLVSDLVILRAHIADLVPELEGAPAGTLDALGQAVSRMERQLRRLRQSVVRTRMVPLSEVFSHMPLAVRDLARTAGKGIRLQMQGENTEVDKLLVERLLDPLLHLVRNSLVHGIETPEERRRAGKPEQGTVRLFGEPAGENILITVSDDGRGIDAEKVAARAVELGWLEPERRHPDAAPLSNTELLDLICKSGLSTRDETDLGAGRGVGMDVVLKAVAGMGGRLELANHPGQGTEFTLHLPLTLTIIDAMIVRCGEERYAIPQSSVDEVVEVNPAQVLTLEAGEVYPFRGGSLSLVRLANLFHLPTTPAGHFLYGLIALLGERRTALVVDSVVGLREVVVRTLSDPLVARPGITGATEMGDGGVILILDLPSLLAFSKSQVRYTNA